MSRAGDSIHQWTLTGLMTVRPTERPTDRAKDSAKNYKSKEISYLFTAQAAFVSSAGQGTWERGWGEGGGGLDPKPEQGHEPSEQTKLITQNTNAKGTLKNNNNKIQKSISRRKKKKKKPEKERDEA